MLLPFCFAMGAAGSTVHVTQHRWIDAHATPTEKVAEAYQFAIAQAFVDTSDESQKQMADAMRDLLFAACSYMESYILTAARLLQLVSYHANGLFGISVECPHLIDHFSHACSLMRESYAIPIRLMDGMIRDGRSISGRVEVKYQDVWGTVCANRFGPIEAAVVCRQLGLQGGTVKNAFPSTDPNQQIWMDELWCTGSELSLAHCSHNGWGQYAQVTVGGAQAVQFYACVHGNGDPVMGAGVECAGENMFNLKQPQGFLDADSSLTIMNLNFGPAAAEHIPDARQLAQANEPAIGAVGVQRLNPTQVGGELMGKNSTGGVRSGTDVHQGLCA